MSDLDLDAIEARAKVASAGRLNWQGIDALRSLVESDVPALVALVRAKESWIDGAKVDMAALEEAAAKATTWHMEALDDLAACVAERDEARAEVDRLTDLLADVNDSAGQWRRRYEALRDGVTGLCDGWESGANDYDGGPLVNAEAFASDLRAAVARVERGES